MTGQLAPLFAAPNSGASPLIAAGECTSFGFTSGSNTVVYQGVTYRDLLFLGPIDAMSAGPVLLAITPGRPVILGRLNAPT